MSSGISGNGGNKYNSPDMRPLTPEQRERNTKAWLVEQARRAIHLRTRDREFHGLEREFLYFQAQMIIDYEKSKDIKHPRDVGSAREQILGKFLAESGLLPKRYSVSNTSVRAASTDGFVSNEIDILLLDNAEAPVLMRRERAYEVYAIESCYGAIQVKSKLTKKELKSAFKNVSSFKKLKRYKVPNSSQEHGFALIFAYDSPDLEGAIQLGTESGLKVMDEKTTPNQRFVTFLDPVTHNAVLRISRIVD